jgi:ankyrin repeat protein
MNEHGDTPPQDPASRFLGFACWDHFTHGRGDYAAIAAAAMRLLNTHPEIAAADIYTAAACGNRARVEELLDEEPSLADRKGGLRNWEPLLYLCYARLPLPSLQEEAVPIARLLLERGANPNAHYMAGDAVYGALVGVAGDGEQDAPPHPARDELYTLLLERGAGPYDIQVLYNTHFRGDVLWWLKLTWQYSVAAGREIDWADPELSILDMGGYGTGARFLLSLAIQKNNGELAAWLLERGANPHAAPARASTLAQMSLYRYAVLEGRQSIADLLLRHGATRDDITGDDEDAFMAACMRLDRGAAAAMAAAHLEYLESPKALFTAAQRNRADAVALLLDLGVPVNLQDAAQRTALHAAAGSDARAAAALLLERGADSNIRERHYQATPLGFAGHYDHRAMIALLTPYSRDVWALARQGQIERLREVLAAEPQRARERGPHGSTLLWWLPDDEDLALDVVELLLAHGADPAVRRDDGTTAADAARALVQDRVADRLERAVRG